MTFDAQAQPAHGAAERRSTVRWVRAVTVMFLVIGLSLGTWLSRLPAVRDQLGASSVEMSIFGLCLAIGSLGGLALSGRIVDRYAPRTVVAVCCAVAAVTLPGAAAILLGGSVPLGLAVLFVFGFFFSVSDVAINVSGANAEKAYGRPRMTLMHAGFSLGGVTSTGIGALAENLGVPVPVHFALVMGAGLIVLFALLPMLPRDELAVRLAAEAVRDRAPADPEPRTASAEHAERTDHADTDSPVGPGSPADTASPAPQQGTRSRPYSPWRDRRIVLIGLITLSFGLIEGTAADWLSLAVVDGRGVSNGFGTALLSIFFTSVLVLRLIGSWLLLRFGRVTMLRATAALAAVGIAMTITLPGQTGLIIGVVAWGCGCGIGMPLTISAAADRAETAARDVAAVTVFGYGALLIGPLAFGFLGEHIGLLTAFWALLPFIAYVLIMAGIAREREG
ncbi:MAG: MFS transporter [Leucobacter sp.]